jgi:GNAT superfamily N-acetyltransferase
METTIREATPDDIGLLLDLMTEFAAYERLGDRLEVTTECLHDVMFGDDAYVHGLLAFCGAAPAGYALLYPSFSSFRGQRGYILEDLFVREQFRGTGIAKLLLAEAARIARARRSERMDFQVLEWNSSAIAFYERHGAVRDDDERHFKFTDEAFQKLST